MRRITIILLVFALLLMGGCKDIDWKAGLKDASAFALEELVKISIDIYGEHKMEAVQWTVDKVNQLDWAKPILDGLNVSALVEKAYHELWKHWYGMLRDTGYDTDAMESRENKLHYLAAEPCPGLHDALVDMME